MKTILTNATVRTKLFIGIVAIVLVSTLTIGVYDHYWLTKTQEKHALQELATESHLMSLHLENTLNEVVQDCDFLSNLPPIEGLIRAHRSGGIDTQDNSTTRMWQDRLGTIFRSLMHNKLNYDQVRFVGVANGGREMVRVNRRKDGGTDTTPDHLLQVKSKEPYYSGLLETAENQFYLSEITYNREHGKVAFPLQPMFRVGKPIYDRQNGKVFGFVIINVDYQSTMRKLLTKMRPKHLTYLVDEFGDVCRFDPMKRNARFNYLPAEQLHDDPLMLTVQNAKNDVNLERVNHVGGSIVVTEAVNVGGDDNQRQMTLLSVADREQLFAESRALALSNAGIGGAVIVCWLLIGGVFSNQVTLALRQMSSNIRRSIYEPGRMDLPVHQQDEVGDLARAFTDLTDSLNEVEKTANSIMENSIDGIVTFNRQGIIQSCNLACRRLFGYQTGEVNGCLIQSLIPDLTLSDSREGESSATTWVFSCHSEVVARRNDGTSFPAHLSISEVQLEAGVLYSGILRDISEQKQQEIEREELLTELERSNRDLDDFAYIASHDLKAPLRVIDNAAQWLEEDLAGQLDEECSSNLGLLKSRVTRMVGLLDDLLEYARIGRDGQPKSDSMVTGAELQTELKMLLDLPAGFQLQFDASFDGIVAPRMPLQQVLLNLISNAIKHHDRSDGTIKVEAHEFDDEYHIVVEDDGPGIAPEYHERVFQMFKTLKPRDQVEGSGMGLAIIKKHCDQVQGQIQLESEVGQGCKFIVRWPRRTVIQNPQHEGSFA